METSKLKEAIAEAEAQAAKDEAQAIRSRRLVDDLRAALGRATNGAGIAPLIKPRLNLKSKDDTPKSALKTAIAVLSEQHQPMHIVDLVNLVSKRRGKLTPRPSLESVLAVAIKEGKFGLRRTAPGTFEVLA